MLNNIAGIGSYISKCVRERIQKVATTVEHFILEEFNFRVFHALGKIFCS